VKKHHVEYVVDDSRLQSTLDHWAGLGWRLVTVTGVSFANGGRFWQLFFEKNTRK